MNSERARGAVSGIASRERGNKVVGRCLFFDGSVKRANIAASEGRVPLCYDGIDAFS